MTEPTGGVVALRICGIVAATAAIGAAVTLACRKPLADAAGAALLAGTFIGMPAAMGYVQYLAEQLDP